MDEIPYEPDIIIKNEIKQELIDEEEYDFDNFDPLQLKCDIEILDEKVIKPETNEDHEQSASTGHVKNKRASKKTVADYLCRLCNDTFSSQECLKQHLETHIGVAPYECTLCNNKKFASRNGLLTHIRGHCGLKLFECQTCGKCFSQKVGLTTHLTLHTGIKPFKCDVCDKTFSRKDKLKTHALRHSEIKSYNCTTCDKAFKQKAS